VPGGCIGHLLVQAVPWTCNIPHRPSAKDQPSFSPTHFRIMEKNSSEMHVIHLPTLAVSDKAANGNLTWNRSRPTPGDHSVRVRRLMC